MNFYCHTCFRSFTTIQAFKSHERSNNHLLKILQKKGPNLEVIEVTNKELITKELIENESNIDKSKDLSDNNSPLSEDLMDMEYEIPFQEEVNKTIFQIEIF